MLERIDEHPTEFVQRTFKSLNWSSRGDNCDPETHGFIPMETDLGELTQLVAEHDHSLEFYGASPETRLYVVKDRDRKIVMHEGHILMVETLPKENPNLLWVCDDSFYPLNNILGLRTDHDRSTP